MWELPAERTKTNAAIDIALPPAAAEALRELILLANGSDYLLPSRKAQDRMLPYIHENTLNVAMSKVRDNLPDVEHFTIHAFRCTARTLMGELKVPTQSTRPSNKAAPKGVMTTGPRAN